MKKLLAFAKTIVPTRSAIPAFECVKIETHSGRLYLVASDMEATLHAHCEINEADAPPRVVHFKTLVAAVKAGAPVASVPTEMPLEDWTPIRAYEARHWTQGPLSKAFGAVRGAVSTEETRYYLNGVHIGPAHMVATDGHRMAVHAFPSNFPEPVIVPTRAVDAIIKHCPTSMAYATAPTGAPAIMFSGHWYTYTHTFIEGTFPDWQRIMPRTAPPIAFSVSRDALLDAAKRMIPLFPRGPQKDHWGTDLTRAALMFAEAGAVKTAPGASVELVVPMPGAPGLEKNYSFQPRYLASACEAFPAGATLNLSGADNTSPVVISSDGAPDLQWLVMPIRV